MDEAKIHDFWQSHPCGDSQIGGLNENFSVNYVKFFDEYDAYRYSSEPHILRALRRFDFQGKRVLEIGLGQGADSEQLIRRGARWSGLDVTQESVDRVRTRLAIRQLPFEDLKCGTALAIPYLGQSFDIVFSHGVLHHIPNVKLAQSEIKRVLKRDGSLIMMVYARNSLNYQIAIRIIRRLGLMGLSLLHVNLGGIYEEHRKNVEREGLLTYLRMNHFIHRSTDGLIIRIQKFMTNGR